MTIENVVFGDRKRSLDINQSVCDRRIPGTRYGFSISTIDNQYSERIYLIIVRKALQAESPCMYLAIVYNHSTPHFSFIM